MQKVYISSYWLVERYMSLVFNPQPSDWRTIVHLILLLFFFNQKKKVLFCDQPWLLQFPPLCQQMNLRWIIYFRSPQTVWSFRFRLRLPATAPDHSVKKKCITVMIHRRSAPPALRSDSVPSTLVQTEQVMRREWQFYFIFYFLKHLNTSQSNNSSSSSSGGSSRCETLGKGQQHETEKSNL